MEGKFGKTSESFKILWNDCRKEADEFKKNELYMTKTRK